MTNEAIEARHDAAGSASCGSLRGWRKAAIVVAGMLLLIGSGLLAIPAFVDLAIFKDTYLPLVEEALHRRVDLGEVHLRVLPIPSIRVSKLRVYDHGAAPDDALFSAGEVQLRLRWRSLLRGKFEFVEFVLERPVLNVANRSSIAAARAPAADQPARPVKSAGRDKKPPAVAPASGPPMPAIPNRVRINDGRLRLNVPGERPIVLSGIDVALDQVTAGRPSSYRLSLEYPGLKRISLEGRVDYLPERGILQLSDNRLEANEIVLPVAGTVSQLAAIPQVQLVARNDGVEAKQLVEILRALGALPGEWEVSGPVRLEMAVTGPLHGLYGSLQSRFDDLKLESRQWVRGRISGKITVRVPPGSAPLQERLTAEGTLIARDGELTHREMIRRLQHAARMVGLSARERREAIKFRLLETDLAVHSGIAEFKRISMINPHVELSGHGTVTLRKPKVNAAVEARLSRKTSARAGRGRTARAFQDAQGRVVVPLRVSGRLEQLSVDLDGEKTADRGLNRSTEKNLAAFFRNVFGPRR